MLLDMSFSRSLVVFAVVATVIWSSGAWWIATNLGLPSRLRSDVEACAFSARVSANGSTPAETFQDCLNDSSQIERARAMLIADDWRRFSMFATSVILAPFLMLLVMLFVFRFGSP